MNSRRALIFILLICVLGSGRAVYAQDPAPSSPQAGPSATAIDPAPIDTAVTALSLFVGRSTIVDIGSPIARVSLTSADVADAMVTSPNQLLVHAKEPGRISMFVWDRAGTIQRYEVAVQRDLARLAADVRQLLPGEPIEVRGNGKFVILSGTVTSKAAAERAVNLATGFVDAKEEVVTLLQVAPGPPTPQVLLRVRFAEVSRAALTEFGLSLFTSPTGVRKHRRPCHDPAVPGPRVQRARMDEGQRRVRRAGDQRLGKVQLQRLPEFLRPQPALRPRAHDSCDAATRSLPEPRRTEPRG